MSLKTMLLMLAGLYACTSGFAGENLRPKPGDLLKSPSGGCAIEIQEEPGVGALTATLKRGTQSISSAMDVGEVIWYQTTAIYSVKPIYGHPGIYAWRCGSRPRRIVGPSRTSKAWPQGQDYFSIVSLENGMITYDHAPDVDSPSLEKDLQASRKTVSVKELLQAN